MNKKDKQIKILKNPQKAGARIEINSFLIGSLFTVLVLLWTLAPEKISNFIAIQIVLAIPLILFASLSYAKLGYKRSHKLWNTFGWLTNNLGYILFLNVTGLALISFSWKITGFVYFSFVILLVSIYYILNIISQPGTFKEHIIKLIFFIIMIFLGGLLPVIL